jgi:GNAT superfamily N-acetyltransferase
MSVTFQTENWHDVVAELEQLWPDHWLEVGMHKDRVPLDPDYGEYARLADTGQLHVTVGRDRGFCVGYLTAIVRPHLHYKSCLSAFYDLYYLKPSYRLWMNGANLFASAEQALKARGVRRLFTGTKLSRDASRLFERSGWDEAERLFIKYIGD